MDQIITIDQIWLAIIISLFAFWLAFMLRREGHRRQEKFFRLLLEYSPYPIILADASGKIIYASRSLNTITGYSGKKLIGTKLNELVYWADKEKHQEFHQRLLLHPQKRSICELRFLGKNNQGVWLSYAAVNLLNQSNIKAVLISLKDISKQKKADEIRLKHLQRERKLRNIAEAAVRSRDEFLSVATHELKTPLTTILLQLQTTLRRILTQSLASFSGEKLVSSLQIAEQQSKRLSFLIKDLLNVSLVTSGRLEINKEPADLDKIVTTVLHNLQDQIKLSGSKIVLKNSVGVTGQWDVVRLEQCFTNLLTNALKYGQKKAIKIEVSKNEHYAFVSVSDQGIGIGRADLERIFKPFERTNRVGKIQGLGVGLFIAQRIAQAHGGDIEVTSRPDQGSTFTLKLPY